LFVCCTTKWQKRLKRIEILNHNLDTLVHIPNSSLNGLKKDSHVDCNSIYPIDIELFKRMYNSKSVDYKGVIEEHYFNKLKEGVGLSVLVEPDVQSLILKTKYLT